MRKRTKLVPMEGVVDFGICIRFVNSQVENPGPKCQKSISHAQAIVVISRDEELLTQKPGSKELITFLNRNDLNNKPYETQLSLCCLPIIRKLHSDRLWALRNSSACATALESDALGRHSNLPSAGFQIGFSSASRLLQLQSLQNAPRFVNLR